MKTELHAARDFQRARLAFTLIEVLIAFFILTLVIAGVVFGYSQANRIAVWNSMSQAAQSFALQGMEQARAAKWNPWVTYTNTGLGTGDEMPAYGGSPYSMTQQDVLDIPMKGTPYSSSTNGGGAFTNFAYLATNYITITVVTNTGSGTAFYAPLRQIQSAVYWTFPLTGQKFSNVVITLRASDQ